MVTPEITYLPVGMGNLAQRIKAKGGGLADVSASLVQALYAKGADVHVAVPNYRQLFDTDSWALADDEFQRYGQLPGNRIHLAEDRIFYYRHSVYGYSGPKDTVRMAMAFQREVTNRILHDVRPDLVHCNDWMTGLIPAVARKLNIPSLLTVHNIHTETTSLEEIEDRGMDAAGFWEHLYYRRQPRGYEESRSTNAVDLLGSGIFAAHFINTVSPKFLEEVAWGEHDFVKRHLQGEIANKMQAGCAVGILNAPDATYNPHDDPHLASNFTIADHRRGKIANKRAFQKRLGLTLDDKAPLFFWPSRLDPFQKGCDLLTDILFQVVSDYAKENLQVAIVADGSYQPHCHDIVKMHGIEHKVAVRDFDEGLSRLGYAASDFMLMPSRFEPCGLPQMISGTYGSLPIVHNTGGLHDTIRPFDLKGNTGNGFVFDVFDQSGLRWAIDQAMGFFRLNAEIKEPQIERVMREHAHRFNHGTVASEYIALYEKLLNRPLI
jgi:starch synthase